MLKTAGVLVLGGVAVVASGCGGSDTKSTTTESKADQAISRSIVLRAADLPGWAAANADVTNNRCAVLKPAGSTAHTRARALSKDDFTVANVTYVFPDAAAAKAAFPSQDDADAEACLTKQLGERVVQALAGKGKPGTPSGKTTTIAGPSGVTWAVTVKAPYSNQGSSYVVTITYAATLQGRVINYYGFGNQDGPIDSASANAAIKAVSDRTSTALADN